MTPGGTVPTYPGGRRWLPRGRLARRTRGFLLGGVWLHLATRWHARELDRRLAAGADPLESDELALRVGQLGTPASRARLAGALQRAVEWGRGQHAPLTATRIRRGAVRNNAELLLALADRLNDGNPLGVRGLAMTAELLDDRSGPLYSERAGRSLTVTAFEALVELDRGLRTASRAHR